MRKRTVLPQATGCKDTPVLSHLDAAGRARMVDVGSKPVTHREAQARAVLKMQPTTLAHILGGRVDKGDVLAAARIAGILAAKRTCDLIPLCHPLPIDSVEIQLDGVAPDLLEVRSRVRVTAKTGVEMEALVAVTVAALTVYDMCKAIDREMEISSVHLLEKKGGRSGTFRRSTT